MYEQPVKSFHRVVTFVMTYVPYHKQRSRLSRVYTRWSYWLHWIVYARTSLFHPYVWRRHYFVRKKKIRFCRNDLLYLQFDVCFENLTRGHYNGID